MCRGGPVAVRRRRSGLTTSSVKRTYLNRSCVWNERLEIRAPWELDNSEGMSCIPDIIVTLMDGNDYVAYKRVPASDVMGSTGSSEQTLFLVPFAEPDDARDKDTGLIGCRMRITHTAPKSLQHRMPADTQSHKNQKGFEAGDGRSEPNANPFLPEPERPGSSFFWLTSPLKTLYYVIWRNWGKYMVAILCI
eukprot:PhM_4_TR16796/c2_g1_i2/m.97675